MVNNDGYALRKEKQNQVRGVGKAGGGEEAAGLKDKERPL